MFIFNQKYGIILYNQIKISNIEKSEVKPMNDFKPEECFDIARKLGIKEYNLNLSNGEIGYLPSLEGLISNTEIVSQVNLGSIELPLKKIKGTYSHLRSLSFAKNFMPIVASDSEFKHKWISVCEHHINEGIRHSIKVYEYLNWFYVVEGNKRVSVLKFFDGYSIGANVTRLIPKKDEDNPKICIYYEFLDFYKVTELNSIWFSKVGNFPRLLSLLEKFEAPENIFNNKYKYFEVYIFNTFRKIYHNLGGQRLHMTTGDAFLEYSEIYGIPKLYNEEKLEENLSEFIKDLKFIANSNGSEVQINPIENTPKTNVFSTLTSLIKPQKKLKVAFVHARSKESSGWTYAHELGRLHIDKKFSDQISTSYVENVPEDENAYYTIKAMAEEGNDIIFTTSPVYFNSTLKCAIEYPKINFFNCSEYKPFTHVNNYYGRIYEPRFLTGIIAGAVTKTNNIGYIATSPSPEVTGSINAFALGAKLVNPYAKVKVSWTNEWNSQMKKTNCSEKLLNQGVDIIANHPKIAPKNLSERFGLYSMLCSIDPITKEPSQYLAAPIWNWGVFYEKIINNILSGTFKTVNDVFTTNQRLTNLWWGMNSGVIDIYYSKEHVPEETQKLVRVMRNLIMNNYYNPFIGPIKDNKGTLMVEKESMLDSENIIFMDWFVENVEVEDFNEVFKE